MGCWLEILQQARLVISLCETLLCNWEKFAITLTSFWTIWSLRTREITFIGAVVNLSCWTGFYQSWYRLGTKFWYSLSSLNWWTSCRSSLITGGSSTYVLMVALNMRTVQRTSRYSITMSARKRSSCCRPVRVDMVWTCKYPTPSLYLTLTGTRRWTNKPRTGHIESGSKERCVYTD